MKKYTQYELEKLTDSTLNLKSESIDVECKDARAGIPGDLWRSITAFANSPGGGIIVFGIAERPNPQRELFPVGNLDLATLQEKIVSLLEDKIENKAEYLLQIFNYKNNQLLALIIDETPKENKPCYNKDLGMDRGACVRSGNTNRQITTEELRAFLRYTPAYNFDKSPLENLSLDFLSNTKIDEFLKKSATRTRRIFPKEMSHDSVLKNLGIICELQNKLFPTLAGSLIFAKEPPQQIDSLSRYIIRCVRYAGPDPSTPIIDKADIFGTIDFQIDETLKFILKNIKTEATIVGSKRIEKFEYPEIALREIIVNALVHRDYSNKGTYILIAVFSDRVEVSNPGTLPPGVTIDNLKIAQFSRNDILARIMRDLDYMEEFGRGIDLVYSKMFEWGLVEPLFKNVSNVFKVTLLGKNFRSLNDRQIKIWNFIQDKSQITASLAHNLFHEVSRATINNDLKGLVDFGLIELKGSSTNIYYIPKI